MELVASLGTQLASHGGEVTSLGTQLTSVCVAGGGEEMTVRLQSVHYVGQVGPVGRNLVQAARAHGLQHGHVRQAVDLIQQVAQAVHVRHWGGVGSGANLKHRDVYIDKVSRFY